MKINSKKGYTLIESMIAISMAIVFIFVIYQVLASMTSFWYQNLGQMEASMMVKKAMNSMVQEIKRAQLSSVATAGSTDNSSITFKVPYQSCDVNHSNCTWLYGADNTQNVSITYLLSSGQLVRQIKDSTNSVVSQSVVVPKVSKLDFALAINDAFVQGASGYLDLNSAAAKPKTYNIKIEYQTSAPTVFHGSSSVPNRVITNSLTSRVTVQNV